MGYIFTILGIITSIRLWEDFTGWAIFVIIVTIYQASSLNELMKERYQHQSEDKFQTSMNIITTIIILILFVLSLIEVTG